MQCPQLANCSKNPDKTTKHVQISKAATLLKEVMRALPREILTWSKIREGNNNNHGGGHKNLLKILGGEKQKQAWRGEGTKIYCKF